MFRLKSARLGIATLCSRQGAARILAAALLASVILVAGADDAMAAPGDHLWTTNLGAPAFLETYVATDSTGNVLVGSAFSGSMDLGGGVLTSSGSNDIFVAKFSGAGTHVWSKRFGDSADQYGRTIATDPSGNVIVGGYFNGAIDFGGGALPNTSQRPIFLAKLDAAGNHVWSKAFQTSFGNVHSIAVDATGSTVVAGNFSDTINFGGGLLTSAGDSDLFVAKFDSAGTHVWSARYGDATSQPGASVGVDDDGDVLLAGHLQGTIDFGGGPLTSTDSADLFVAKLDASGVHEWSDAYVAAGEVIGVTADGDENVVVAGNVTGTVDFGGGPLTGWSPSGIDAYIAKFDANGAHVWSDRYSSIGGQFTAVQGVAVSASGNVVLTGLFDGLLDVGGGPLPIPSGFGDVWVASFDENGGHEWSKGFGEADSDGDGCSNNEELGPMHVSGGQRNPALGHDFYDVNTSKKVDAVDIGLVRSKFNQNWPPYDRSPGPAAWAPGPPNGTVNGVDIGLVRASFGDSCQAGETQLGFSIAADSAGDVVVTGSYVDSIDFGGGALPVPDGTFLVKFDAAP